MVQHNSLKNTTYSDITSVHTELLLPSNWSTQTALGSDHLPFTVEPQRNITKSNGVIGKLANETSRKGNVKINFHGTALPPRPDRSEVPHKPVDEDTRNPKHLDIRTFPS